MTTLDIVFETGGIKGWDSFHDVSKETFGFPDFYGANMDAWIDCFTYLDDDDGMTNFRLSPGDVLNIHVTNTEELRSGYPDIFAAMVDCLAFVNQRYVERNSPIRLLVTFL